LDKNLGLKRTNTKERKNEGLIEDLQMEFETTALKLDKMERAILGTSNMLIHFFTTFKN